MAESENLLRLAFDEVLARLDGESDLSTPEREALTAAIARWRKELSHGARTPRESPPARLPARPDDASMLEACDARLEPVEDVLARLAGSVRRPDRYEIEGELARGGMGAIHSVVDRDLRRRIAMKVALAVGGDAKSADAIEADRLARFLDEAQITGQLDHPGIVPVHELGLDGSGRVYFTMRLVRGRELGKIFELARRGEEGWTQPRALNVLLRVCEAIAYAHSKGVVHRDLKPSNVMVGRFGEVYVMDWGLAKVLGRAEAAIPRGPRLSDGPTPPLMTAAGDVMGTPAYMSPEQARGENDCVDERTDVYAVGAILYQFLAGHAPYGDSKDRQHGRSTWLSLLDGPPTSLRALRVDLPPELVAICERAMERDLSRRYQDISSLAADLNAWLEGRVVRAYETGAWAEARKWVRRNRALSIASAAAILILIGGTITSSLLYVRASDNAETAERRAVDVAREATRAEQALEREKEQRIAVEARKRELERVSRFQSRMLAELDPEAMGATLVGELRDSVIQSFEQLERPSDEIERAGNDLAEWVIPARGTSVARKLLDRHLFARSAEAARREFADVPLVRAMLMEALADSYSELGLPESALELALEARDIRSSELGDTAEETLNAQCACANLFIQLGRWPETEAVLLPAIEIAYTRYGPSGKVSVSLDLARAGLFLISGRLPEGTAFCSETLARWRCDLGDDHRSTLQMMRTLASVLDRQDRDGEAEALYGECVERARRALGPNDVLTLQAMQEYATTFTDRERAEELARDVYEQYQRALGDAHPRTVTALHDLALAVHALGTRERTAEAGRMLEEVVARYHAQFGDDHVKSLVATTSLANNLARRTEYERAEALLEGTIERARRVLGPDAPQTLTAESDLGAVLIDRGKYEEAEPVLRRALDARRRTLGPDHSSTLTTMGWLSSALENLGQLEEAEELLREVHERRTQRLPANRLELLATKNHLAMMLRVRKKLDEAEQLMREALAGRRELLGADHANSITSLHNLALILQQRGEFDEAETLYAEAYERCERVLSAGHNTRLALLLNYGLLMQKRGRLEEAERLVRQALDARRTTLGESHTKTLTAMSYLGGVLLSLRELEEAQNLLEECEWLCTKRGAVADEARRRALENLAKVFEAKHETDPSGGFDQLAYDARKRAAPESPQH
jgi:tetratricopeptide (TPR) repeat protein